MLPVVGNPAFITGPAQTSMVERELRVVICLSAANRAGMRNGQKIARARRACRFSTISEIHFDGDNCCTVRFQGAGTIKIV
jgi:hypothetical protein